MKQPVSKDTLFGLGLLVAAPVARAQNKDHKTAFGFHANLLQYRGDLGNNFWNARNVPIRSCLALSRYLSKSFDLTFAGDYNKLRFPTADGNSTGSGGSTAGRRFCARFYTASLGFKLKPPVKDEFFVHPYILVQPGFGWVVTDRYATPTAPTSRSNFAAVDEQVGLGLGLDFRLGPDMGLYVQAGQHMLFRGDALLAGPPHRNPGLR